MQQLRPIIALILIVGVTVIVALALSTSATAAFASLCGTTADLVPLSQACPEGTVGLKIVDIANSLYTCCIAG